ncbi:DNA polymerase-1 [Paramicrobacterium humi]|uniref:DNA-directed DNA polymerase n=1 Tax=Paramicrobacterium humi TaxID=640635 RepID=A0A1H4IMS4_9MICO|nr:bifunctional 3'-5' exonuclease/DNA polymerase [Microbacterium humi]SEB35361.1 DNA polymerase-1 [Microbacterium humi]
MHIVLDHAAAGPAVRLTITDDAGRPSDDRTVAVDELPATVAALEEEHPRWVFARTAEWYPRLLASGIRFAKSHDLSLCRTILRRSTGTAGTALHGAPRDGWDEPVVAPAAADVGLFEWDERPAVRLDPVAELQRQLETVAASSSPGRLSRLLAAESCGAMIACEIRADGLPWRRDVHERLLSEALGPRPRFGGRPAKLERLVEQVREKLAAPRLNPDSQPELLRALRNAGVTVNSTSKWALREIEHPAIAPLLEYKSLSRLLSANGWAWLDEWVHEGRFRPEYVVAGVVTGRWASSGGGALQLPAQVRPAVVADEGWTFIVADAAQLEPRIVAAMAGDRAMARAGQGADLYQGLVDAGTVDTRKHAKVAMLGALYGATTGESARLMPRLVRAYPRATGLVEAAARAGERGDQVTTWLGRSSPLPAEEWRAFQRVSAQPDATAAQERAARAQARDWGRFTRNFVAQGTAAEWALCWLAELRHRLNALPDSDGRPHLVYFLHDEVVVHSPLALADQVARAVQDAADAAGRGLFGDFPIDFPLGVAITSCYADAKP